MKDKKTYYVSVQAEAIMEHQGDAAYEFEIQATDRDVGILQEMFESLEDFDNMTSIRAHVPYVQYHNDPENDRYDAQLQSIYRKIHELGTQETKRQIEQMDIL